MGQFSERFQIDLNFLCSEELNVKIGRRDDIVILDHNTATPIATYIMVSCYAIQFFVSAWFTTDFWKKLFSV